MDHHSKPNLMLKSLELRSACSLFEISGFIFKFDARPEAHRSKVYLDFIA